MQEDYDESESGEELSEEQKNFLDGLRGDHPDKISDDTIRKELKNILKNIYNPEQKFQFLTQFLGTAQPTRKTNMFLANEFLLSGQALMIMGDFVNALACYSTAATLCSSGGPLYDEAIELLDHMADRKNVDVNIALEISRQILIKNDDHKLIEKHSDKFLQRYKNLENDEERYLAFKTTFQKDVVYPDHFIDIMDNELRILINDNPDSPENLSTIKSLMRTIEPISEREAYWCRIYHGIACRRNFWNGDAAIYQATFEDYPGLLLASDEDLPANEDEDDADDLDAQKSSEKKAYNSYFNMVADIYESLASFKALHDYDDRSIKQIEHYENKIKKAVTKGINQKPKQRLMSMINYSLQAKESCRLEDFHDETYTARIMKGIIENWHLPDVGEDAVTKNGKPIKKLDTQDIQEVLEARLDVISFFTNLDYQSTAVVDFANDKLVIYSSLQNRHYDDKYVDLKDDSFSKEDVKISRHGPLGRYYDDLPKLYHLPPLN